MAVNSCRLGLKAYEEVYTTGCLLRAVSLPVENSNGIRSVQEPSRNRSRPGQLITDSVLVAPMSEPAPARVIGL